MQAKDSNQPKKKLTPWRHQRLGYVYYKKNMVFRWSTWWNIYSHFISIRKVNSEYRAKFLSPAQYLYKAGAWTRVKENVPNQVSVHKPSSPLSLYHSLSQWVSFSNRDYSLKMCDTIALKVPETWSCMY